MAMPRDLPSLAELADEIVGVLGNGTTHDLVGEWPTLAIAFEGHHALLLRDHTWSLTLSLPSEQSWPLQTRADWERVTGDVCEALAAYLERHSSAVSISDAIVALQPMLETMTGAPWKANLPGTPVPAEAWLKHHERSVGLLQAGDAVNVVVWAGSDMRANRVTTRAMLAELGPWLEVQLRAQDESLRAVAAELARVRALPLPTLDDLLSVLRSGKRIVVGGGRWSETYFWENERLRCSVFDEGFTEVIDATTTRLARCIELHADELRRQLE